MGVSGGQRFYTPATQKKDDQNQQRAQQTEFFPIMKNIIVCAR